MAEELVRKDVFDATIQRIEAVMDKKLTEVRGEMSQLKSELRGEMKDLRGEMKELRAEVKGEIKTLSSQMEKNFSVLGERIDKNLAQYESITRAIEGDVKTLNARVDAIQHRRGWDLAWTGIIVGGVVGLIQMFVR